MSADLTTGVIVDDAPPPPTQAVHAMDALLGKRVRLSGLQVAAHLNGKFGIVTSYDSERGRYEVSIDGGDGVRVKPANLEAAPNASAAKSLPTGPVWSERGGPPTINLGDAPWLRNPFRSDEIPAHAVLSTLPDAIRTKVHVTGAGASTSTGSTLPTALASVTNVSASVESASSVESHDSMETRPDAGSR